MPHLVLNVFTRIASRTGVTNDVAFGNGQQAVTLSSILTVVAANLYATGEHVDTPQAR